MTLITLLTRTNSKICKTKKHIFFLIILSLLVTSELFSAEYYWENPQVISTGDSRFPSSARNNTESIIVWEEIVKSSTNGNSIYLSAEVSNLDSVTKEVTWKTLRRFLGPFPFSGEVPHIYSVAINSKNTIAIAVLSDTNAISVFTSNDNGESFEEHKITDSSSALIAPRIYSSSDDGFILFATQGAEQSFLLQYSSSTDGTKWSQFSSFEPSVGLQNSFIPTLVSLPDKDLVVFQASYATGNRLSYQLYSTYRTVGSNSWSPAKLITDSSVLEQPFGNYHNQRANLLYSNGKLYMAWERNLYSMENAQAYIVELDSTGQIKGDYQRLSSGSGNASQPVLFSLNNSINALWFDNRRGVSTVYFAQKNGFLWNETTMTTGSLAASFAVPVVSNNGVLNMFWQQTLTNGSCRIIRLLPDTTVSKATIRAQSYTVGRRATSEKVTYSISLPSDSSGISGYSYSWSQDSTVNPPMYFMSLPSQSTVSVTADNDGEWYFKVRVLDYAGNWSESSSLTYYRDTTPPKKPEIAPPDILDNGFLPSNTFELEWSSKDDDVSGYTYNLQFISDLPSSLEKTDEIDEIAFTPSKLPSRIMTQSNSVTYNNRDDGLYVFSISAIDQVGNIGEPTTIQLFMNKYIPYTSVSTINTSVDEYGVVSLSMIGKGFSRDGIISEIYISKNGKEPYDKVLKYENGDFNINSDRRISNITLESLEEGEYYIVLLHTGRGVYRVQNTLTITEFGTVKIGDYSYTYQPSWRKIFTPYKKSLQVSHIVIPPVLILVIIGLIFSIRGIINTAHDSILIRKEIVALIEGDSMPLQKKKKAAELKQRGVSLKYKLVLFTSCLVILIILLVSIPLGFIMTRTQEKILAQGLKDRVSVLMESLASGVKSYMPSQDILELSFLPGQSSAISEANYVTILGFPDDDKNINLDYVWASNDENILEKIDTTVLSYGKSRLIDEQIQLLSEQCQNLNEIALDKVYQLAQSITALNIEGTRLALSSDSTSVGKLDEIQNDINRLSERLLTELSLISKEGAGSIPEYEAAMLSKTNTEYLFYKPVLYRQGAEQNFVRGVVLVEISTIEMLETVSNAKNDIIKLAVIIALIAIGLGVVGSLLVASYIISPIRKLAYHVAMIRDTEDKSELEGKEITIKSKDELGTLGDTVNDMTHGLVKAAAAAKDLTVGKEVQKMFIPLEVDDQGRKLTTGKIDDERTEFFGYYEGAKGVSGDYFDYLKLDDKHYAIIKCDVSGKGVPAALIMVEVATLFLHYFRDWSYKKNGYNLSPVVSQINDLIESRGFKGRFAAFTLCIYNADTGEVHFCNAGDNLIHMYDSETNSKKTITLPESPAAGVFPEFMVEMKGGYKVQKLQLKPGDVLFLYTDGIEEAKRMFRDENLNLIVCAEPGLAPESPHGYHSVGQDGEEMAPERVNGIIEAVFHRTTFKLEKFHNPIPNEELIFDFSSCNGTAEDAIMALVSVEKIFRMYKNPEAKDTSRVQVDVKIDSFLKEHFLQYSEYCSNKKAHPEFGEYLYYMKSCEDDQYDDLTLVAIKRKK